MSYRHPMAPKAGTHATRCGGREKDAAAAGGAGCIIDAMNTAEIARRGRAFIY